MLTSRHPRAPRRSFISFISFSRCSARKRRAQSAFRKRSAISLDVRSFVSRSLRHHFHGNVERSSRSTRNDRIILLRPQDSRKHLGSYPRLENPPRPCLAPIQPGIFVSRALFTSRRRLLRNSREKEKERGGGGGRREKIASPKRSFDEQGRKENDRQGDRHFRRLFLRIPPPFTLIRDGLPYVKRWQTMGRSLDRSDSPKVRSDSVPSIGSSHRNAAHRRGSSVPTPGMSVSPSLSLPPFP